MFYRMVPEEQLDPAVGPDRRSGLRQSERWLGDQRGEPLAEQSPSARVHAVRGPKEPQFEPIVARIDGGSPVVGGPDGKMLFAKTTLCTDLLPRTAQSGAQVSGLGIGGRDLVTLCGTRPDRFQYLAVKRPAVLAVDPKSEPIRPLAAVA
jgi:hypothetical protein